MIAEGRLEIVAGRILSARDAGGALEVSFAAAALPSRSARALPMRSTAPGRCIRSRGSKDPLLRSLLDAGQVKPDHLGIGLDIDGTAAPASIYGRWGH